MLSGEGNAGEQWKTTKVQLAKKATLHVQHTFLYISLPLFCTTTTWNFQKLLSYTFYGGNVVRVLVHFFFTAAHFHLASVAASISHFVTAANKFSCCSSDEKCLLCFLSLFFFFFFNNNNNCRPFSRWVSVAYPPTFSFSLSFSCSIFQICGHDN